jgi:uncharacterized protein YdaU (DUF1376 family)
VTTRKKADTWMPWYVADYLADTAHLSTEQHGAYCLMLMAAWKRGGSLPKDDAQLAAVCRLTPSRWKAHRSVLLEFFTEEPTQFAHKRVTKERVKAQEISDKKSLAGQKGGTAKARNASKPDSGEAGRKLAEGVADAKQTSTPSPSPSPLPSEEVKPAGAGLSPATPPTPPDLLGQQQEPPNVPPCPHRRVLALFREKCVELPQPRVEMWEGSSGAEALGQRWKFLLTKTREDKSRYATNVDEGLEWLAKFFTEVSHSDLLMGRKGKWRADLAWLMKRENFVKVVQGNYTNEVQPA